MNFRFMRLVNLLCFLAFWDEALTSLTILVSDPTTKDTPVVSACSCLLMFEN